MAMLCNVSWAQTVVGALGNPTTTLTDGNYVLMAKSSKNNGNAGPVFFNTTASGRKYQYDTNSPLGVGDAVLSKYVWTIDETTDENGVQHITVTNYDDNTKFFPADGAKNQNFSGSTKASLKPEVKNIGGVDYIVLTLDDSTIGYIHANQDGNNPNLSYWNSYGEDGTCVKFTFHPVVELSTLNRPFYTSQAPNGMTWRENTTWYFIQFPNSDGYHTGGYLAAEGSGFISSNGYTNNVSNGKLLITQTEKPIKSSALWCIVGDETNGYKFYNKMNPKLVVGTASDGTAHLYLASETKNGVSYAYDYAPSGSGTHSGCATFRVKGTNKYWNNYDGDGDPDYLSVWDHSNAVSDNGSAIRLTQVTEHELAEMAAKLPVASTAAEKKYYTIKNQRSADYATYIGDDAQIKHQARDTESAAQMWYFTADGNGYRLHNLATTNKYKNKSSFTADGAKVWVKENPYCAGYVCISTQENLGSDCWDSGNNNLIGTWNPRATDYEGTSWMLEEVSPTETLPLAKLDAKLHVDDNANILGELIGQAYYIIGEVKVYDAAAVKEAIEAAESIEAVTAIKESFTVNNGVKINSKDEFTNNGVYSFKTSKGWLGATESCANVISTAKTSHNATGDHNDPMFQWAVYQSANGNYYLYNLGKKMFMGVQNNNEQSIPFVEHPAGKKLTFKQSNSADYPIMLSTNNSGVVNHNGSITAADGVFTWTGGWNNLNDGGSNHQVTLVSELPEATLQEIAAKVAAYDRRLYVTAEVTGSWENNPNTHFGDITATSSAGTLTTRLKTTPSVATVDYDGLNETTIGFTRDYRGYEFQGYSFGGVDLGKSFTLTDEQKASITAENPLVAKFRATEDVTLFYDDDPFPYRIPAIATTSTGRLIAVSDYRHCLDDIGLNRYGKGYRVDLVIRTSDDNGKTWSPIRTIAEGIDNSQANDCGYGDAAIAVVGEEVVVMAVAGSVAYGSGSPEPKKTSRLVRIYSADNGVNWEKTDITEKVYGYEGSLYPNVYTSFFGSGRLAVDPNFNNSGTARIYGSMLTQGNGNIVIYSDDKGLTWNKLGGQVANANEPKIEILPSGQILFSARRNGGRNFNVFTYEDKSASTGSWSDAVNGCDNEGNNGTNGETFLVDAKNARGENVKLLLQSQPVGGGTWDRANVSIWYKEISSAVDHKHTPAEIASGWTKGLQVSHQLSAYSAMSLQEDGKIAFFFEEAPCYRDNKDYGYSMVYVPLTVESITKGNYFSSNADLNTPRNIKVVLTDAEGNVYKDELNASLTGIGTSLTQKYPFITLGNNVGINLVDESYTYTNTVALPFKVSNEDGTYWHNIYYPTALGNQPIYLSASQENDEYVTKHKTDWISYGASTYNTQGNEKMIAWAIFSVNNSFTFKFKNKLTQKFIQVTSVSPDNASLEKNVKYVEETQASSFEIIKDDGSKIGDYSLKAKVGDTYGYLGSTSASHDFPNHFNRSNHEGSWVIFKEAPDFDALITEANEVLSWIGEGLGKYTVSESKTAIAETAKTEMQTPNMVTLNDLNTYKNLLEGATLNRPESGQFYRISHDFGDAGVKYLQGVASSVNKSNQITPPVSYDGEKGAASIFYYSGSKLLSYTAGTYLREQDDYRGLQGVGDTGGDVTFGESPRAKGKYTIRIPSYLHANTTNSNYHSDHCSGDGHAEHDHSIEEVTSLPFTFNSAGLGFATFNAPVAVELPEGVLAYVTQIKLNNNTLQMYRLKDKVVPANTPVMLYCEAAKTEGATKELKIVSTYTGNEFDGFKYNESFYGTIDAEPYPTGCTIYSLRKSAGKNTVGFYQKASGNLGGFKAWIKLDEEPDAQGARTFTIIFDGDDATGLKEALGLENENVEIYDLSGRRLDKPTTGINIVGGKLVIK